MRAQRRSWRRAKTDGERPARHVGAHTHAAPPRAPSPPHLRSSAAPAPWSAAHRRPEKSLFPPGRPHTRIRFFFNPHSHRTPPASCPRAPPLRAAPSARRTTRTPCASTAGTSFARSASPPGASATPPPPRVRSAARRFIPPSGRTRMGPRRSFHRSSSRRTTRAAWLKRIAVTVTRVESVRACS